MSLTKPTSVYVTVRDASSGTSKTLTVYGTPGEAVFTRIEEVFTPRITDAHPAPSSEVQDLRTNPVVVTG